MEIKPLSTRKKDRIKYWNLEKKNNLFKGQKIIENFMLAYYGGNQPSSKDEGMAQIGKWKAWVGSLGENLINTGTPLMDTKIVTSRDVQDENDPNSMKGFAVVKADSIEAAVEIARSDPFLDIDGRIHVSQMKEMK